MLRRHLLMLPATLLQCAPMASSPPPARTPNRWQPPAREFEWKSAADLRVDESALAELQQRAQASQSDAVVILVDGSKLAEWNFVPPVEAIETMSVTKSIVSLAIGKLVDLGMVASLDAKLAEFFPSLAKDTARSAITLRHILSHTSGLEDEPTTEKIYAQSDFVRYALEAPVVAKPGEQFFYSNRAMCLLSGVVKVAAKRHLDEFVGETIFDPLDIRDFSWERDRENQPHGFAGLSLRVLDLAKLGLMLCENGTWGNRRVLSEQFVRAATSPASNKVQHYGLGFWLIADRVLAFDEELFAVWAEAGVPAEFIQKMRPLVGRNIASKDFRSILEAQLGASGPAIFEANTSKRGLVDARVVESRVVGFRANGYLGQYLVGYPGLGLVGARLRRVPQGSPGDEPGDSMADFAKLVRGLRPTKPSEFTRLARVNQTTRIRLAF